MHFYLILTLQYKLSIQSTSSKVDLQVALGVQGDVPLVAEVGFAVATGTHTQVTVSPTIIG